MLQTSRATLQRMRGGPWRVMGLGNVLFGLRGGRRCGGFVGGYAGIEATCAKRDEDHECSSEGIEDGDNHGD